MKIKYFSLRHLGIIIFILVIIILTYNSFKNKSKIEKYHKYTIAKVYMITGGGRTSYILNFEFLVDNKIYRGKFSTKENRRVINNLKNRKFLVEYYPINPKNCQLLICYPVPDSFIQKSLVWEKIPDYNYDKLRTELRLNNFDCMYHVPITQRSLSQ